MGDRHRATLRGALRAGRIGTLSAVSITGAGGYIGGRLLRTLAGQGVTTTALVREPDSQLAVPTVVCDLADVSVEELGEHFAGNDTVVHLAGETEVLSAAEPALALNGTIAATERVAEACVIAGVRRLVYLSTIHVYGDRVQPGATLTEDLRPEPRTAYALSRLASEHLVHMHARRAYEAVVLRLTNSVGAPEHPQVDRWTLVANDLCRQGAVTGELRLLSSGSQWRDFVPLGEVCRALARAVVPGSGSLPTGTYNLGSGRPRTVRSLAELVQSAFARETGRQPELIAPAITDSPAPYHVSVERAAAGGLRLDAPLQDAVTETVRFCLEHREELP